MSRIIVGVDGSGPSLAAAGWAAEEAHRRGASLEVVHVVTPWLFDPADSRAEEVREWLLEGGQEIVDRGVQRARERIPDLDVTGVQTGGQPAGVLIGRAREALMLVAGTRGMGGLTELLLGSVALQVVSHARCPAAVVRDAGPDGAAETEHAEVVVGVDGSESSVAAIGFAFGEAAVRKAKVRAVMAWGHPVPVEFGGLRSPLHDPEAAAAEKERVLLESIAGWRPRFPGVEVVHQVVHARPVRALAWASAGADLLVVGSRGHGGFAGLLLGSVGHAMLHHACCPVAVIPAAAASSGSRAGQNGQTRET